MQVAPRSLARRVHTVVFSRHGESTWNLENRFTGWVDVQLTPKGVLEARRGGAAIKREGLQFDAAYTSVLSRAIKTCWTMLEELEQMYVPVATDWRLNERHYGALSGLNKAETALKHGEDKVSLWRRSYDVPPPPYDAAHPHFVGRDRRYAHLAPSELPLTESTKSTGTRVLPMWEKVLKPAVARGQRLLVVAHGNSLRALVKHIDGISDADIVKLNIPTGVLRTAAVDVELAAYPTTSPRTAPPAATRVGVPRLYQFDEKTWAPIPQPGRMDGLSGRVSAGHSRHAARAHTSFTSHLVPPTRPFHQYLGDLDAIKADVAKVAAQASAKKA
jgi:2,3-bisphosphoglycerate-dependent phosphoglycerate mutase